MGSALLEVRFDFAGRTGSTCPQKLSGMIQGADRVRSEAMNDVQDRYRQVSAVGSHFADQFAASVLSYLVCLRPLPAHPERRVAYVLLLPGSGRRGLAGERA